MQWNISIWIMHMRNCVVKLVPFSEKKYRWTVNGCTMKTDVLTSLLIACIIFWLWSRQTSRMVSCAGRAYITKTRRITPLQKSFTTTFSLMVSYPSIFTNAVHWNKKLHDVQLFIQHLLGCSRFVRSNIMPD